ncbi:MAG: T9SS type A sorting domain-containing protein [Bacteroidota bacterium]
MKKITLLVAFAISTFYLNAQSFIASYPFANIVGGSGGTTDPTPVPTATGVTFGSFSSHGVSANPNAGGRFSFTGWSTGSTGGPSDTVYSAMTGSLVDTMYYEVTVSPAFGFSINLDSITFTFQRSGAGVRTYTVRSSADGFTNNLNAIYGQPNTTDTVMPGNIFYLRSDISNIAQPRNQIVLGGANFSNLSTPITFRFYAWNAEASGGTFSIDNVRIVGSSSSMAPAVITDPASLTICTGASATFFINATNASTYQWEEDNGTGFVALSNTGVYSGVDNDTLVISNTTGLSGYSYHCVVTNGFGSTSSNPATLTESSPVTPNVTIPSSLTMCANTDLAGSAVVINEGATPSYTWYLINMGPVGYTQSLFVPAGTIPQGTYQVYCALTSSEGCTTVQTVNSDTLTLVVYPAPIVPLITETTNILSTNVYDTYQWYYGTTALGTNQSDTVSQSGIYTVSVANSYGCTAVSANYNFVYVGINEASSNSLVSVYPNPSTDGLLVIDLGTTSSTTSITVFDIVGKAILSEEIAKGGKHTIDLSAQANGSYFISIKNDKSNTTQKVTIAK